MTTANPYQIYLDDANDSTCWVLISGYNFDSKRDLLIHGVYSTEKQALHALDEVSFNSEVDDKLPSWKIRQNIDDFKTLAPQLKVCEVPFNRNPFESQGYGDCKLTFKKSIGIEPFWLEEQE